MPSPSTPDVHLVAAVRNNAAWCDAVCRAHGAGGAVHESWWASSASPPRFYPDLITLQANESDARRAAIATLAATRASWSVKDSFSTLDLAGLGAKMLFAAQWQMRLPGNVAAGALTRIETEDALALWERAWTDDASAPRLFLPALLRNRDTVFAALYRDRSIAAGAIFLRADGVCGLSNVFGAAADRARLVHGAGRFAMDLPLVTYAPAPLNGFEPLGPLRVWVKRG